jgi:pimeloyl-ACP methyl ester carboxylesterase
MGSIIFLPGILGTRLYLGTEEIWPPTIQEYLTHYGRIEKLLDPGVTSGDPIDAVCMKKVYRGLLDDLTDIASGRSGAPVRAFHSFGYDWRRDLFDIAVSIAERIDNLPDDSRSDIHFVGHSMGTLIIRLILESGKFNKRSWFGNLKTLVSLAGPHKGAPTALIRALGLEGSVGLTGPDIQRMAADPRYPSLYQLFPAPGSITVWNDKATAFDGLNLYDSEVSNSLKLSAVNLRRAKALHTVLSKGKAPQGVRYVFLAGTGEDTWLRINITAGGTEGRQGKNTGDGTVPLWSAVDPSFPNHAAPGAHDSMFTNAQVRSLLYKALGARLSGVAFASIAGKPLVSLHVGQQVYRQDALIDVTLAPATPTRTLDGNVVVEFSDSLTATNFRPLAKTALRYQGPETDSIKVRFNNFSSPGVYRIGFDGSHEVASDDRVVFAVSEDGGSAGGQR